MKVFCFAAAWVTATSSSFIYSLQSDLESGTAISADRLDQGNILITKIYSMCDGLGSDIAAYRASNLKQVLALNARHIEEELLALHAGLRFRCLFSCARISPVQIETFYRDYQTRLFAPLHEQMVRYNEHYQGVAIFQGLLRSLPGGPRLRLMMLDRVIVQFRKQYPNRAPEVFSAAVMATGTTFTGNMRELAEIQQKLKAVNFARLRELTEDAGVKELLDAWEEVVGKITLTTFDELALPNLDEIVFNILTRPAD